MKWGSAWKVLQISDCKGEIAKPKPFIKGMLETINQLYLYIESLIIKNFSRSRQRPQSYIGDATGVQWYDVSFQLNPGKVEIVVFIHNLKKYDAHHVSLRQRPLASCWRSLECNKPKMPGENVPKNFEVLKQYESDKKKLKLPLRKRLCPYRKWTVWNRLWANQVAADREKRKSATRIKSHYGSWSDINLYKHSQFQAGQSQPVPYLKTDVLPLKEGFENVRSNCQSIWSSL